MAWLIGDGFDILQAASATLDPDTWSAISGCVATSATGKYGRGVIALLGNNSVTAGNMFSVNFGNTPTIFVNMTVMITGVNVGNGQGFRVGFRLRDGGTDQMGFWMDDNGYFRVTNGLVSGTLLASSSQLIPTGSLCWHHIQVKITIHNTLGSVELRVNGSTTNDWTATGLNTRNGTANAYCNVVVLSSNNAAQCIADDFFCFSDTGDAPNDWIVGETCSLTQVPTSDSQAQWTRNGGASNFSRVSQLVSAIDGDTTYNASNMINQEDRFGMGALAISPSSIIAVQTKAYFRQEDTLGPHRFKIRMTSNGVIADSIDNTPTTTYLFRELRMPTDPATGLPWTEAGIEAATPGYVNVL